MRFPAEDVERSILERFEQQVRVHGGRLAIESDSGSLTYADLNRTATGIARRIVSMRGSAPEPIALLFDRGAGIVASILAVLEAGKFYLILDASYPDERLKYLLADSGTNLIVTTGENVERARKLSNGLVAVLDIEGVCDEQSAGSLPKVRALPDDLAMVIYTSGSTGRPKGVTHTHRNILADTRNVTNELGICEQDRLLWHTSVGFAGSARTIYSALLNGATLYPFDNKRQGFDGLSHWLLRHRITIFRTVPTTYRGFMATLAEDVVFPDVRMVSMGGEPLFPADVVTFNRHFLPHAILVHPFAPTESMAVCWNVVRHGEAVAGAKVPIGYALQGVTVLLLDEDGRQVVRTGDEDEIGEIAVKSRYLSPGYWRDADGTNAAFFEDESGDGERIYRTGDLGKRSRDGRLTHMGRRDFQVKVRGFRIEVSEIETALREIDGVSDAVVVGKPDDAGQTRLVAYYVPAMTPPITVSEIRARLARLLPDYLVPSVFAAMEALPKTSTGKTDRLRLPDVNKVRPDMTVAFTAPRTPTEASLARLWTESLEIDRVGVHDNFFEIGGDSLLALKLFSRIEQTFRTRLSLKDLIEAPTIAGQADRVAARAEAPTAVSIIEVRRAANTVEAARPPLLIGPTLFGHVGEWRELFQGADFDRAVYAVEFHGDTAYPTEHPTLEQIVADITDVVIVHFPDGAVHLTGHSFGAHVAYELGQQLRTRSVPPLSIVLVDSRAYGSNSGPPTFADVVSMTSNIPRWLVNELRVYGLTALWTRVKRRVASRAAATAAVRPESAVFGEDPRSVRTAMRAFDWSDLPPMYQRRVAQSYTAIRNYRARPTQNRIVYLQCRVQRLIHRHGTDGGWGRYVSPDSLDIRMIPGDHGSALHVRWQAEFLQTLRQALDAHS